MANPKITVEDILNVETGEQIKAIEFFESDLDKISKTRSELQRSISGHREALFVCSWCKQKVRIRGGRGKEVKGKRMTMHFAHLKDSPDCFIKTQNTISKKAADAIKYNGQKESQLHIFLKEKLALYLNKTSGVSNIQVEKVIKSDPVSKEWRKPDLNAIYKDKRIAFEIQLSTTWLDVITKRQEYYRKLGFYMIWVFNTFNPDDDARKLAFDDVIFTNCQNAYVFDQESQKMSEIKNELVLKCYFKKYQANDEELSECWDFKFLILSNLYFDETKFKVFHYDSDLDKKRALKHINLNKENKEKAILEKLEIKRNADNRRNYLSSEKDKLKEELKNLNEKLRSYEIKERTSANQVESAQKNQRRSNEFASELLEKYLRNNNSRIYIDEDLIERIDNEFKPHLIERKAEYDTILSEFTENKKKIERLQRLEQKLIDGTNYSILDINQHWDFILRHFDELYCIDKQFVNDIFSGINLKKVKGIIPQSNLKFQNSYYLLYDFNNIFKELSSQQAVLEIEIKRHKEHFDEILSSIVLVISSFYNNKAKKYSLERDEANALSKGAEEAISKIKSKILRINNEMDHL